MKLTLPLLVPASKRWVPWVMTWPPLGKNEQRPIASRASGVAELSVGGKRQFKYVRVWQPGQADHATKEPEPMGLPALVLYLSHRPAPRIRKQTADADLRAAQRPALLCDSPGAAAAVYDLFKGFKKCVACGEPFTPLRKDQTHCYRKCPVWNRERRLQSYYKTKKVKRKRRSR
ncbi:MAG: hypothetical protein WAL05_10545 [Candidatus Sulfotelmatobacter sp.]